jgi:Tfp pilus assembly protein PilV
MWGCHRRSQGISDETGFALVETIVSAVVLLVIALATLAAVDRAQSTSAIGKGRSVAASLAEQDQERLRSLPASSLSTYRLNHSSSRQVTVGGLSYNVASTVDWVRDATGATPSCTSDDNQADYLNITSTVTGNAVRPVTISSLVSPPLAFSNNRGTLAVKILDGGDQPVVGLPVSISGPTAVTDTTNEVGCAVFAFIPAGDYRVQFSRSEWVDPTGDNTPDVTPTVNPGKVNQISVQYDHAGAITVRFDTKIGTAAPTPSSAWTASAMHTGVTGSGIRSYVADEAKPTTTTPPYTRDSIVLSNLFPFRSGYQTFAGECKGSNPDTAMNTTDWFTTGGGVGDVVTVPPGDTTSNVVTVRQPALTMQVKDGAGNIESGANVVLTPKDTTCINPPAPAPPTSPVKLKATTNASGMMTKYNATLYDPGVPFGKYDICVDAVTGVGTSGSGRSMRRYVIVPNVPVDNAAGVTVSPNPVVVPSSGTGTTVAGSCPTT